VWWTEYKRSSFSVFLNSYSSCGQDFSSWIDATETPVEQHASLWQVLPFASSEMSISRRDVQDPALIPE
jgi:hypothetical protein